MKVIAVDILDRDYKPEQLITVSISLDEAIKIADSLNSLNSSLFYKVVEDSYSLNLESMHDTTDIKRPVDFIYNQFGLAAIVNDTNLDVDIEILKTKSKTELETLIKMVEEALKQYN